ncbi:hypothetical protein GRS96_17950 [Rathayibacter sp. VKM Ac-2803]|uniref:hypothetical protein n=1 Tax=unclassified Rathayibacter TaxID=2609250 RepID=UPI00135C7392|nr:MULTISPECIES: hypothetical protein [unclassified Rathayibacter]MWV51155.1 hypothetical protein [Rathayibacter sp. VKM Ac-2803]MWV57640.1 hypothetical protein [Rathayibacter sp. VKM Ac-2754]
MSTVARCNAAFAALGAGLVHVSSAAGRGDAAAVPLAALGVVELAWAVAVLALGRFPLPRTALSVAAIATAGLVLVIAAGLLRDPLPLIAAGALLLAAAAVVARTLRAPRAPERSVPASRAVIGLLAGALTVSALATPALAASSEGTGDMGGMMSSVDGGHGH